MSQQKEVEYWVIINNETGEIEKFFKGGRHLAVASMKRNHKFMFQPEKYFISKVQSIVLEPVIAALKDGELIERKIEMESLPIHEETDNQD